MARAILRKIICLTLSAILITQVSAVTLASINSDNDIELLADDSKTSYMSEHNLQEYSINFSWPIIPNVVYENEEDVGKLPPITTGFVYENVSPYSYGDGKPVARIQTWVTASDGYVRKGYKEGTFESIGALALSFIPGAKWPVITVSAILSAVGIFVSNKDTYVKGETLISYRYTYRDGEARWSSDPDTYYSVYYRTGMRETFRHVLGGVLENNRWTFDVENFDDPIIETTTHYNQSDAWILDQARIRLETGDIYDEVPW